MIIIEIVAGPCVIYNVTSSDFKIFSPLYRHE